MKEFGLSFLLRNERNAEKEKINLNAASGLETERKQEGRRKKKSCLFTGK